MTTTHADPIHLGNYQSGTPQFQEARRNRLGGSEIAAVLGLHNYESHLSLWFRKHGDIPPQPDNPLMEWGRRLEPLVWTKFVENHINDESWDYSPGSYTHPERAWQLASPDGMGWDTGQLVEVKTVQTELDWGEEGTDQIPISYRCQALWNMDVLGANRCWLPILIRGAFYREYLVEMDDQAEADLQIMRDAGQKFIQSLLDNQPPSIDGHDATYQAIRQLHPDIETGDKEIPRELADNYLNAAVTERNIKEDRQRWAAEIMQLMGTAKNAIDETGQRFAYRKPASNPDRTPYLMVDPAVMRSLRPSPTIPGATA
jgi:putative phage-type endonuclease